MNRSEEHFSRGYDAGYEGGWNSAIDAVCKLVEIDTPNLDDYTSKQLAERIYFVLYGKADECNTSTQGEESS